MKFSSELIERLYRNMQLIRISEERLVPPILSGAVRCPVHLYTGQEAVATGLCLNLEKSDHIFGNHRSHGHYLAKGGSLKAMFAEIYGKIDGCCKGRGGSMHLIDIENGILGIAPIVAGTISLATGSALASKIRNQNRVVVTFFGDGATGEGVLYESMNFAALKKLPVIFACENNLYSTHLPIREIRVNENISEVARPFDIPAFKVDGNDVLDVYQKSAEAVKICRSGSPVFMEFMTYRMRGHVGPDDNVQGSHTDIRPLNEVEEWKKKDPILRLKSFILKEQLLSPEKCDAIDIEITKMVEEAHDFAITSSLPPKEDVLKYVTQQ